MKCQAGQGNVQPWTLIHPESRLPGEMSVTLDTQMTPPLWQKAKKNYNQPRQHIIKQRHYFANKGLSSQIYVFFFSQ